MIVAKLRLVRLVTTAGLLALPAMLLVAVGTAGAAPTFRPGEPVRIEIPPDPFAGMEARFRRMAKRDEVSKDWHRALMRWEAVVAIVPTDKEARTRISAIRRLLKRNADKHFAAAKQAQQKKQYARAFREYIRTLSYDPENHLALTMVKYELNAKSVREYKVKRGDTVREIAQDAYGDGEMDYVVLAYNKIRNPRDLKVGQTLRLPVIAGVFPTGQVASKTPGKPAPEQEARPAEPEARAAAQTVPEPPEAALSVGAAIVAEEARQTAPAEPEAPLALAPDQLAEARAHFDAKRFDESASAAESVLELDPANNDAQELVNASYYERGRQLADANEHLAAMQVLTRVDPAYKDVEAVKAAIAPRLQGQEAEVRYIAGVTAFLNEDLDTAILEWERTLKLDPDHPQAAKDLANAQALRAKLAAVQ